MASASVGSEVEAEIRIALSRRPRDSAWTMLSASGIPSRVRFSFPLCSRRTRVNELSWTSSRATPLGALLPKKSPTAYLKDGQLFFDTIVFTPEALRHLIAETGSGQIMIGTDYPFPWTSTEVDLVLNTPGLTDDERIAILGGTAAMLLGIAS